MVFTNQDDMFLHFLRTVLDNDDKNIDIATFGLYLGISKGKDWQDQFPVVPRTVIDAISDRNLRLVVGIPTFVECVQGCVNCRKQYNQRLANFQETAEMLDINMKFHDTLHLKYYYSNSIMITGGINMSNGKNIDCALTVDDVEGQKILKNEFEKAWTSAVYDISKFFI